MKTFAQFLWIILLLFQSSVFLGQKLVKDQKSIAREKDNITGTTLNKEESRASEKLDRIRSELAATYSGEKFFPPARSFFQSKNEIENTSLFRVINLMPKGGALHLHTEGTASAEWVIRTAISEPHCYIYWGKENEKYLPGQIAFYKDADVPAGFRKASELASEEKQFFSLMLRLLTFTESTAADTVKVWKEFERRFQRVRDFAGYKPLFKSYYMEGFQDLIKDNVQYAELRAIISFPLYDLEHSRISGYYNTDSILNLFSQIQQEIRITDPAFSFRLIYTYIRGRGKQEVDNEFLKAFKYEKKYPALISGFDLVGEEDAGHSTAYFSDVWKKRDSLEKACGLLMPFVFHDGESNNTGDENLYDAVFLNSKRIGHGFNLFLFPSLYEEIRRRDIALEICPLSSQILHFVHDLRIHPAAGYLKNNIPCVISSDDPSVFGYTGLSYDFWEATMAWNTSLATLKKLVYNSLRYSLLPPSEKKTALAELDKRWAKFITTLNKM